MNNKLKGTLRRQINMGYTLDYYATEPKITFKNGSFIQVVPDGITYNGAGSLFIDGKLLSSGVRYVYE